MSGRFVAMIIFTWGGEGEEMLLSSLKMCAAQIFIIYLLFPE